MNFKTILLMSIFLIVGCNTNKNSEVEINSEAKSHSAEDHYYTCTMHPQVHEKGPGNCPICGMPLVKVSGAESQTSSKKFILSTDYQKDVLGFTKGKVEKRKVSFKIPASGRLTSTKQVAFYIYETDFLNVKVGQRFVGECSAMGGEVIDGQITHVDKIADPSSRSVRVLGIINSHHNMTPIEGSFFGEILSKPQKVLMIPYDSVLRTGTQEFVYIVSDSGELAPRSVKLGRTLGDEVEVLKGVEENEVISFGPNFLIDSEARLKGLVQPDMEGM